MAGKLNALIIERAQRQGQRVLLCDGAGLYLRKQTRDGASWILRYSFGGRERWLTLGSYPDMSLGIARIEARQARVQVDKQQDPIALRRAAQAKELARTSFEQLCEDWYRTEIAGRGLKHPDVPRRYLDKYLLPKLRRVTAAEVTPAHIVRLLDDVRYRTPTVANDLLRFARRIFSFGVRRQIVAVNPVAEFSPRLDAGGPEKSRSRTLSHEELIRLFESIRKTESFGGDNLLAIKLLLALCVRKSELLGARWEEFDLQGDLRSGPVWHLPGARTKTGEGLDIPLVPQVVEWLQALKVMAVDSEFVFPKRRQDRRHRVAHVALDTLNVALLRVAHGLPHFTLHDLRRTARTHLAALGVRREVAERCLGHKLKGVEGTYDRHDYFRERRAALSKWTQVILEAEHGRSTVTPLQRSRG
jgi:integrase